MHVDMLREGLAPGVEDECRAELTAEPARVGAELQQRLRGGGKQPSIEQPRVALGQGIELVWEGKHDVKVRRRE